MAAESANAMTRARAGLIPDGRRRGLAPAERVEVLAGGAPTDERDECPDDGQDHDAEDEERLVVVENPGRGAAVGTPAAADPVDGARGRCRT